MLRLLENHSAEQSSFISEGYTKYSRYTQYSAMPMSKKPLGEMPFKRALKIIERRWSCGILHALLEGERSFAELQTAMEAITPRMLSRRLREFEELGIIATRLERRPNRVYYRIKGQPKELREMFGAIKTWARKLG